jgi:hypothetical protein
MDLDLSCEGVRLERETGVWTGNVVSVSFWFRHRNRAIAILIDRSPTRVDRDVMPHPR